MTSKKIKLTARVGAHRTTIMTAGRIISVKLVPVIGKEVEVTVREIKSR